MGSALEIEYVAPGSIEGFEDLEQRAVRLQGPTSLLLHDMLLHDMILEDEDYADQNPDMINDVWLITKAALQSDEPDEQALTSSVNAINFGVLLTKQLVPPQMWSFNLDMVAATPAHLLREMVWDRTQLYGMRRPTLYAIIDRFRPYMNTARSRADLVKSMAMLVCLNVDESIYDDFRSGVM